jgi:hypothetical protein
MAALNLFNTKIKKNRVPHQNDQPIFIFMGLCGNAQSNSG